MTRQLFTLTLCLLFFGQIYSQKIKINVNKIVTTDRLDFKNNDSVKLFNYDFTMKRRHYSDSTFLDFPLFCSCDTCTSCGLLFKKNNGDWFIKADDEWQEFFNLRDSLIKVVYFKKQKFILKPLANQQIFINKLLFGFIQENLYINESHISNMWFHPDYGVVIIGQGNELIRQDFINAK